MSREPRRVDVALDEWVATHEAHRADGYTFFDFVTAVDETDIEMAELPSFYRDEVEATISVDSRPAADERVASLRAAAEKCGRLRATGEPCGR